MERLKPLKWLGIVVIVSLFALGWYFPGKDPTNVNIQEKTELPYKEAVLVDKTHTPDKGKMWKEVNIWLQRERTNVPYVYKYDTIKGTVNYYVTQ